MGQKVVEEDSKVLCVGQHEQLTNITTSAHVCVCADARAHAHTQTHTRVHAHILEDVWVRGEEGRVKV